MLSYNLVFVVMSHNVNMFKIVVDKLSWGGSPGSPPPSGGHMGCAVHRGPRQYGAPLGITPEIDLGDDWVHRMMSQSEQVF